MSYQITWSDQAHKHFLALDMVIRQRVAAVVDKLADDPRPVGVKALTGMPGVLRIRVGDYRVLYTIDNNTRDVWIEDVRHRSKAYGGH